MTDADSRRTLQTIGPKWEKRQGVTIGPIHGYGTETHQTAIELVRLLEPVPVQQHGMYGVDLSPRLVELARLLGLNPTLGVTESQSLNEILEYVKKYQRQNAKTRRG